MSLGSVSGVDERSRTERTKLVVVVLLTGGKPAIGPAAAGIAGDVYRRLDEQKYFAGTMPLTPATLVGSR